MRIVILNSRDRFRTEDLEALDKNGAIFYEKKGTKLKMVTELSSGEDVILAVQPSYIEGSWKGLPWEKLKEMRGLRGLCLSTTAYGWVPFEELAKNKIPVTNVPGKSTDAVGEYYVFLMIALLRKFSTVIKNDWSFEYGPEVLGTDAKGLKTGIVGLGKIGRKIADLCAGFGMDVFYWNRSKKQCPYKYKELIALFREADVIFVTTLADDSTKGLISHKLVDSMKKTAIFLSPIDPVVYDRKYILQKVEKEELGGVAFESEEEKIANFKGNVFAAPEIGYYTKQTLQNESRIMTESILSIVSGKPINVVNL